jgi:hypothetical protein
VDAVSIRVSTLNPFRVRRGHPYYNDHPPLVS